MKRWGTQSRYMKMFYIGSMVAIILSVGIICVSTFVVKPSSLSNVQILLALAAALPVVIMGLTAMKLGSKETRVKGAKKRSNDGKN